MATSITMAMSMTVTVTVAVAVAVAGLGGCHSDVAERMTVTVPACGSTRRSTCCCPARPLTCCSTSRRARNPDRFDAWGQLNRAAERGRRTFTAL